ncbi:MAG: hypothetical protein AB1725_10240 [Armatimonadota bacterium]
MTIVQVLVATGLLALLSALLFPTIRTQIDKAKQKGCASNLRQLHAALMLYREAQDGAIPYGRGEAMGLPPILGIVHESFVPNREVFRCKVPSGNYAEGIFTQLWAVTGRDGIFPPWHEYVTEYKEDAVLLVDMNHDPADHPRLEFVTHYGIAVYLGGHVRVVHRVGTPTDRTWWNPE